MSDIQRGSTKHGPRLDEEMEHESRGIVQGSADAAHVEPFRETEPLPDDTDDTETEHALHRDTPVAGYTDPASDRGDEKDPDADALEGPDVERSDDDVPPFVQNDGAHTEGMPNG